MQLENKPVEIGMTLYFPIDPRSSSSKFKPGRVVEINETVRAVKLLFSKSAKPDGPNLKREWLPVAICKWSEPKKVEVVK